ncbi:cell division protein SepF [Ruicaihuangia caeni]|uniref:Cell division protein SepF n=1 Tax=Ruicaihuangia caeni TaxID=3042517 RepID=A0AAW6TAV6_9MICO|nr:cell division protein SepF [Klugiella sp. YN-L-19]MDI2098237.1 cell division protein SepF [Klugiella sp. YN-L-19]
MANPLRKTMVYLGLADEEYDDEQPQPAPAAASQASTPQPSASAPAPQQSAAPAGRAPVTPLRRASAPRPTQAAEMNEILTVHPRQYKDAQVIAENFREGIPVIINLSQMTESDARRLVDFSSGLTLGLRGKIERVTAKVFLLSPEHIAVSGEQPEADSDVEASFFSHQ